MIRRWSAEVNRESGSVTAEMAVALPALLVVLAGALTVLVAVSAQLRCVDAARLGARAAARGDPDAAVVRQVLDSEPAARVTVGHASGLVRVRVALPVAAVAGSGIGPLQVGAESAAAPETTVAGDP